MYIKKGDKVQVLSGKDRGKQGVILRALPAENKVVVEGVSVVKKAVKPNAANQQGKGPDAPRHPGLFLSPLIGDRLK